MDNHFNTITRNSPASGRRLVVITTWLIDKSAVIRPRTCVWSTWACVTAAGAWRMASHNTPGCVPSP